MLVEWRGIKHGDSEGAVWMQECALALPTSVLDKANTGCASALVAAESTIAIRQVLCIHTSHFANRNQIYEWRHIFQSMLRQVLNNSTLLPLFSLTCQPQLELDLYQKLKQSVQREEDFIIDNKAQLKLEIEEWEEKNQPVSEVY